MLLEKPRYNVGHRGLKILYMEIVVVPTRLSRKRGRSRDHNADIGGALGFAAVAARDTGRDRAERFGECKSV